MKNGIIYTIFDFIIEKLKYLNLVELFKYIFERLFNKDHLAGERFGMDIYILLKWIVVFVFWTLGVNSKIANVFIWYLIASNIYTYFYYHIWTKDLEKGNFDIVRIKRRFLNLMLAVFFNGFCFAYFFAVPFLSNFSWPENVSPIKHSILFSFSNSITANYDIVKPITEIGNSLLIIETFITFIFLTIILSNTIPQIKNE